MRENFKGNKRRREEAKKKKKEEKMQKRLSRHPGDGPQPSDPSVPGPEEAAPQA